MTYKKNKRSVDCIFEEMHLLLESLAWFSKLPGLGLRLPKALMAFYRGYMGNIGILIITNTISGVLYYNYSIMCPKTLF